MVSRRFSKISSKSTIRNETRASPLPKSPCFSCPETNVPPAESKERGTPGCRRKKPGMTALTVGECCPTCSGAFVKCCDMQLHGLGRALHKHDKSTPAGQLGSGHRLEEETREELRTRLPIGVNETGSLTTGAPMAERLQFKFDTKEVKFLTGCTGIGCRNSPGL